MNTARKHFFLIHFNSSGIINRCLVRNISSSVYGNFGNGNLEVIHVGILLQDEGNLCPRKLNAKKFFHSLSWCAGWKLHHQKHQDIVNQGEVLFNFRLCLLTTRCWKIPFDDFLKAWWFIPKEKLFFFGTEICQFTPQIYIASRALSLFFLLLLFAAIDMHRRECSFISTHRAPMTTIKTITCGSCEG